METIDADVAILGAGTAGLSAVREVEKAGKRFVLIDSGPYGTTCARVGCMPSKLLIAAASVAHEVRRAPELGVDVERARVDGARVMERVRRERDRFVASVVRATEAIPEEQRLVGVARFVDANTLEVGERARVRAHATVIATGSRPTVPPPFDAIRAHVDTSDEMFEWRTLPASVAVVGTGVVALDLGIGERPELVEGVEERDVHAEPVERLAEVEREARAILSRELAIHIGISEIDAEVTASGVRITWSEAGTRRERAFERVLVAAGRVPNRDALDLAKTGLPLDARGRPPWDPRTCQCGDAPIFMAGDASGHLNVLHEASDEGHIAGENAARWPNVEAHERRTGLTIVFTEPQMALVGQLHADLGSDAVIGEVSYAKQGRARVMGVNAGLVRLYAERASCRLLGAEMLGPGVEHLSHLVAWAVQREMTIQDCLTMPFYHPVLEEGLRTALRDAARKLDIVRDCRGEDLPDSPGQ